MAKIIATKEVFIGQTPAKWHRPKPQISMAERSTSESGRLLYLAQSGPYAEYTDDDLPHAICLAEAQSFQDSAGTTEVESISERTAIRARYQDYEAVNIESARAHLDERELKKRWNKMTLCFLCTFIVLLVVILLGQLTYTAITDPETLLHLEWK